MREKHACSSLLIQNHRHMLTIYQYKGCDTCRKAIRYLEDKGLAFKAVPIREKTPSQKDLKRGLKQFAERKKLCNVSGQDYRAMGLKDTLADMTDGEFIKLLSTNGNLIKRPFVVTDEQIIVGF